MSEARVPTERWKISHVASGRGKKATKIELFPARYFREKWEPGSKDFARGSPPMHNAKRREFWASEMYRVRVDGKWIGEVRYRFYSKEQVFEMYFK